MPKDFTAVRWTQTKRTGSSQNTSRSDSQHEMYEKTVSCHAMFKKAEELYSLELNKELKPFLQATCFTSSLCNSAHTLCIQ